MMTWLRDAHWLTAERARALRNGLLMVCVIPVLLRIVASRNGTDASGWPVLGLDYVAFWRASSLVLSGHAGAVYESGAQSIGPIAERFPEANLAYATLLYPPIYLLACLPLALLPFFWSLAGWLAATLYAFLRALRSLAGPIGTLTILAFPAVLMNVVFGQNGLLTAALFGGGIAALGRRPLLAGFCFGCLAYKPHLALMVPLLLASGRHGKALLAAAATVAALCLASVLAFGVEAWRGFVVSALPLSRAVLEGDAANLDKMQSAFAAVRMLGGGLPTAYAVQAVVAVLAAVAAVLVCLARPAPLGAGALMATAGLLATPHLLHYDLALLAIPLAWLFNEARRGGFLPWEKAVLVAGYLLPLLAPLLASGLHMPVAPAVIGLILAAVARRLRHPGPAAGATGRPAPR